MISVFISTTTAQYIFYYKNYYIIVTRTFFDTFLTIFREFQNSTSLRLRSLYVSKISLKLSNYNNYVVVAAKM